MSHPSGTAYITYESNGITREWGVSCIIGVDTEEVMRRHLAHWYPHTKFISVHFVADEDKPCLNQRKL